MFNSEAYTFNAATIRTVNEISAVYGLARPVIGQPNNYTILYVGETENLHRRLTEHLDKPPARGIMHFFAEAIQNPTQRLAR